MHTLTKPLAACLLATLLAACGGGADQDGAAPSSVILNSTSKASAEELTAASYHDIVQRIYVAYFGRPADPGGLAFYANYTFSEKMANTTLALTNAYNTDAAVRLLIESFGNSDESKQLYAGDNVAFISAIYRNLFNREPDAGGLAFWVNAIDIKAMTRPQAAVQIMSGAQGDDTALINKKIAAAQVFTSALDTPFKAGAYDGAEAGVVARTMLSGVTLATDIAAFGSTVQSTLVTLYGTTEAVLFTSVSAIIQSRCVGCHSSSPTIPGFSPAPMGIRYDTATSIRNDAQRISNVVSAESMPYGNFTNMTASERTQVGKWFTYLQAK